MGRRTKQRKRSSRTRHSPGGGGGGGPARKRSSARAPTKTEAGGSTHALPQQPTYLSSFRRLFQWKTILLLFYDLLFWALLFIGLIAYSRTLTALGEQFEQPELSAFDTQGLEQIGSEMEGLMPQFIGIAILLTIVLLVWLLLAWSLTRGMIWRTLLGERAAQGGMSFWAKCFGCLAIWNLILAVFWVAIIALVKQLIPYNSLLYPGNQVWFLLTAAVLLFTTLYFTELLHYLFASSGMVLRSIQQAVIVGIQNFPKLALRSLIVITTFALIAVLSYALNPLPPQAINVISVVLLLAFAAWMRYYLTEALADTLE